MIKTMSFFWLFWIAAFLIAVLGFGIVWWQAIVIIILSNVTFSYSVTYR